jgi:hypothetical protein
MVGDVFCSISMLEYSLIAHKPNKFQKNSERCRFPLNMRNLSAEKKLSLSYLTG